MYIKCGNVITFRSVDSNTIFFFIPKSMKFSFKILLITGRLIEKQKNPKQVSFESFLITFRRRRERKEKKK